MSAVGHCADNAACEDFFGLLKRERVHHRQYRKRDEARAALFDYLERFHNPRMRRESGPTRSKVFSLNSTVRGSGVEPVRHSQLGGNRQMRIGEAPRVAGLDVDSCSVHPARTTSFNKPRSLAMLMAVSTI